MLKLLDNTYTPKTKKTKSFWTSLKKALATNNMPKAVKLAGKLLSGTDFDAIGLELTESGQHQIANNHLEMTAAIVQCNSTMKFEAAMAAAGEPWLAGYTNSGLSFAKFNSQGFTWEPSL